MKKRYFLKAGTAMIGTVWLSPYLSACAKEKAIAGHTVATIPFEVTKTEAEWQTLLSPAQFHILRQQGTEQAGTSPLDHQYAKGTYVCAGCRLPLFTSDTKFNSQTGWPSFFAPITGATGTLVDKTFSMTRTEVHCRRCGGHLGHVFIDGPPPTGKRYCINGIALIFIPA